MPQNLQTLPLEIQREIYRNLLLGSRLRRTATTTTYHFYTSVLRVSKSVFSISHQVLYNENDFVLIEDGTTKLMQNLRLLCVPIVSYHVPEFKEHRLSISFGEYVSSPSEELWCPLVPPCPSCRSSSCSFMSLDDGQRLPILLHAQDSALYVRAFAILEHCVWFPTRRTTLVRSARGVRPFATKSIGGVDKAAVVVIGVEMNSYDQQDLDKSWKQGQWQIKREELLKPFRNMPSTRRVVLRGVEDGRPISFARELQMTMCPSIIWLEAMGWHLVHVLRSLKSELDASVRDEDGRPGGCVCQALLGYDFLLYTLRLAMVYKPQYMASARYGIFTWQYSLCVIGQDTALTLSHILFYQGYRNSSAFAVAKATPHWNFLQSHGTYGTISTPEQHRILQHFRTLGLAADGLLEPALQGLKQEISQAIKDQASEEEIEHLRRDLTFLRIHIQGEQYPEITLPRGNSTGLDGDRPILLMCTQVKKPLGTYIFPDSVVINGPDGLEGWLDMKERLTDGDCQSLGVSPTDLPAELLAER